MNKYTTMLTIAGSDSIGGAGIQADIKMAHSLGVYAMSAITAVTAQNTCGVESFVAIPAEMVKAQILAVAKDEMPMAIKIGMLPNADVIKGVAEALQGLPVKNIIIDPVMVATSGDVLNEGGDTVAAMREYLFPLATLITPNIPEGETLLGRKITGDYATAVKDLQEKCGVNAVLLKGGHNEAGDMTDYLAVRGAGEVRELPALGFVDTPNTHGTGCSLSSAIASYMALGEDLYEACRKGKENVYNKIKKGADYTLGHGHGPIYQF